MAHPQQTGTNAIPRPLAAALALSLLLHLMALGSAGHWWRVPQAELDFPIEASLLDPVPAPPPAAPPPRRARPADAHRRPAPAPSVEPPPALEPAPTPAPSVEPPPTLEPAPTPTPSVEPPPTPAPVPRLPPQLAPERPALRQLPAQLKIVYAVETGSDGFVAGRATYLWHSRNGRYSLVNTVEATGLASLFISGRIVQLSEGEVGAGGLRPAQYWLQRKERKQETARFDWGQRQLTQSGAASVPLTPQAQDLLSFPFQLALTAREGEPDFGLGVTNGKRFREYTFTTLGRERLTVGGREMETLHLVGRREGEGSLDVWLDLARHGLPVQVRTQDQKGKVMRLLAEVIEGGD